MIRESILTRDNISENFGKAHNNTDLGTFSDHFTDKCHPLHWACRDGHIEVLRWLLDVCNTPVNMTDMDGLTPLMIASSNGSEEIVDFLVERNADCRAVDITGKTALHHAVLGNNISIVKTLVSLDGILDAVDDDSGATALHYAALHGHIVISRTLIDHKCLLGIQNREGDTPLHIACKEDWSELALLLMKKGASMAIRNTSDLTPYHLASDYLLSYLTTFGGTL